MNSAGNESKPNSVNPLGSGVQDENLFKYLIENTTEGLACVKEDHTFLYGSPAMGKLLGIPEKELTGRKVEDLVDPLDAAIAKELLEAKTSGAHGELRLRRPDGQVVWVDALLHNLEFSGAKTGKLLEWHDITGLKNRETKIEEEEIKAHLIFEAARDYAFIILNPEGKVTTWSEGAEKVFGYSEQEILGKPATLFFPADEAEAKEVHKALGIALLQGRAEVERWHVRKDGSRFYAAGVMMPIRDREGRLIGFCKIVRDVTDKWLAQEALRQSREFYSALIDSIDGVVWEAEGESKKHTFVSKKAEQLLGYPVEKWYGPDYWNSLIVEEDRKTVETSWQNAVRDKKPYSVEFRIRDATGRKRWFRDYVSVVEQPQGPVKLRAVLVEITSQKSAEKRHEMQLQIMHILAVSSSIDKAAQDIFSLMGHEWEWDFAVFWYLDRKADALSPIRHWRLVDTDEGPDVEGPRSPSPIWIPDFNAVPLEDRSQWMQSALEKGYRSALVFSVPPGDKIHQARLEFYSHKAKSQEPDILEMASIIADQIVPFIERMRAEEALRESQDQLRHSQKMEAIGRLAGGVAHDFNNLLTAINGYSELLISQLDPTSPLLPQVEEIHKAGQRAATLTNQLLAYSRRQVLAPQIVNLNSIISDMGNMLKRLIGEDIHLEMRLVPDIKPVKIDPGQMGQVIMNLVVNSRDAMPTGGELTLETAKAFVTESPEDVKLNLPSGEYVRVTVTDTGRGIDESTKAHLFEPFFTTKEAGKGTGLGLSTVEGIIQQSGGGISLYSEIGKGTAFDIYLPVESAENASSPLTEDSVKSDSRGHETILLVEDEDGVRMLAKEILIGRGYDVLAAGSGTEALKIVENFPGPIHLLLTDFIMEGMNGRQVFEAVAERRPEIRVLFMSGYTEDAIVRHGGTEESVYSFLQKPFSPAALADKVYRALRNPQIRLSLA